MIVGDKVKLLGTILRINNYELDTKSVIQLEDGQIIEVSNEFTSLDVVAPVEPDVPVEP